ncbi:hypothetical protein I4U23_020144 [Adineta vaga]|nr:hypothetical protein I4U23_020144 [Adineta vaga]
MASKTSGSNQVSSIETKTITQYEDAHRSLIYQNGLDLTPLIYGLLIGLFAMGIVLAVILTLWLTKK